MVCRIRVIRWWKKSGRSGDCEETHAIFARQQVAPVETIAGFYGIHSVSSNLYSIRTMSKSSSWVSCIAPNAVHKLSLANKTFASLHKQMLLDDIIQLKNPAGSLLVLWSSFTGERVLTIREHGKPLRQHDDHPVRSPFSCCRRV